MNKAGYNWLIMTQFAGWVTVSCVVIFWTSFTGIDVYKGNARAIYGSTKLKEFENGVNFGVFGLLLKAVISVNTSLAYPWFAKCFSNRSLFIIGEFIMATVCILVFVIENEIALLILISSFGFAMQLHMQTCPEFTGITFYWSLTVCFVFCVFGCFVGCFFVVNVSNILDCVKNKLFSFFFFFFFFAFFFFFFGFANRGRISTII